MAEHQMQIIELINGIKFRLISQVYGQTPVSYNGLTPAEIVRLIMGYAEMLNVILCTTKDSYKKFMNLFEQYQPSNCNFSFTESTKS